MASLRSSRRSAARALLALCLLAIVGLLHLFASAGCSSGAICYRNTDCPYASDCKQGQCVRRVSSEASAGTSSVDDGAAGAVDQSQTPDAN
ncbi:MAG TPA: hypothetical protein VER11_27035 [Polyangiaceae bacterium]|nr:hypothetical protein [Polyangiaceae bacterium]